MRKGNDTESGARTADRNELVANHATTSRAVWNMHDALLIEQRRTNQLLEILIGTAGGNVPPVPENPTKVTVEYDPGTGMLLSDVEQ